MLLAATVLAGFTACETDSVEQSGGKLPDKEEIENVYGILRCSSSCENTVDMILTEGNGFLVNGVYFEQTKPVSENVSIQLQIDESVIEAYNTLTGVERTLLPESNYEFVEGNMLEISANGKQSALKRIKFLAEGLAAGEYVLPVSIGEQGNVLRDNIIYFNITIREPFVGDYPLDQEEFIRKKVAQMNLYSWYFMSTRKIMIRDWLRISTCEKDNVDHRLMYGLVQ